MPMMGRWLTEAIETEVRQRAKDAALLKWQTGSADTTQMLLCVEAALQAAVPYLFKYTLNWAARVLEEDGDEIGYANAARLAETLRAGGA